MSKRKDNVVRMEKKATNKFGLFLLFIAVIGGFGYGGYYLYEHRKEIDWEIKLPWKNNGSTEDNPNGNKGLFGGGSSSNRNEKLVVPNSISSQEISINDSIVRFHDINADDKGFTFEVDFITKKDQATLTIEKLLIDGFDNSAKLTITDVADAENSPTTGTIRVQKSELDALGIYAFNTFSVYLKVDLPGKPGNIYRKDIRVYHNIEYKNGLSGLIEIYNKDLSVINFYKTTTDKDNTYLYFNFVNEDRNVSKRVKIKKLLINGELYDYSSLDEFVYSGANKVFYITIPKKDIKDIEDFTISFFILTLNRSDETTGFYITPEYSKKV